jgi:hypothetical protein
MLKLDPSPDRGSNECNLDVMSQKKKKKNRPQELPSCCAQPRELQWAAWIPPRHTPRAGKKNCVTR